jgi:hypothetical protein
MRKSGTRFSARIPRQDFGEDHVHDIDVDLSKHRDRRCRSIETSGSKMSIHRNIGIEDVDPSKHRDRNGLVQSKVIVI